MASPSYSPENYHRLMPQAPEPVRIPIQNASGDQGTGAGNPPIVRKNTPQPCCCGKRCAPWLVVVVMFLLICGLSGYADYQKLMMFYNGKPEIAFYAIMDIPYDPFSNDSVLWQKSNEIHEGNFEAYHDYWQHNKEDAFLLKHPGTERVFREVIKVKVTANISAAHVLVICIKDGRAGGFVHDFIFNQTAIVDPINQRCFLMPLDCTITSSPETFVEMGMRMAAGDYDINLKRTLSRLRVTSYTKPCRKLISPIVLQACYGSQYYMVEDDDDDFDQNDEQQEIPQAGKFAEFFGNGYVEFDIVNIPDVEAVEKQHSLF